MNQPVEPPIWNEEPYAVTDDGRLLVCVVEVQGPEWVRQYQRWSLRVGCEGVYEPVSLSLFLNLGNDPSGPSIPGRQSKFFEHWAMANGGAPNKGQAMNFDVFMGKYFWAEVKKGKRDSKGQPKADEAVYSKITRFLKREDM